MLRRLFATALITVSSLAAVASATAVSTAANPTPRRAIGKLRENRFRAGKAAGPRADGAAALLDRPFQRAFDRREGLE